MNLRALFHKNRAEQEMDEEFRFHLEKQIEQNIARGMNPDEARYAALRQFGNAGSIKEDCRDTWGVRFINEILQDLRYGLRQLRRNPGFTAVAVLTLSLGIGATIAIFSVMYALLFKPLPVFQPNRLVEVCRSVGGVDFHSYAEWKALQNHQHIFSGIFAYYPWHEEFNLKESGEGYKVGGLFVSGGFFKTLGVHAILGRTLRSADDRVGVLPVCMIGYELWRQVFGQSRSVLGQTVVLHGHSFQVVGVAPRSFFGVEVGRRPELFIPLEMRRLLHNLRFFSGVPMPTLDASNGLSIIGRLKAGITVSRTDARLRVLGTEIYKSLPGTSPTLTLVARPLSVGIYRSAVRGTLLLLVIMAAVVLLIVCANLGNLLLARATRRQVETAARLALGATRWRLIRQHLTESVVLSVAGTAGGLVFAWWASRALLPVISIPGYKIVLNLSWDARLVAFTIGVTLLCTLAFGLAPAIRAIRVPIYSAMTNGVTTGNRSNRFSNSVLVVVQVALSVTVFVSASLFVRTLYSLLAVNRGYDARNVLVAQVGPGPTRESAQREAFEGRELLAAFRSVPGVMSASWMANFSQATLAEANVPQRGGGEMHIHAFRFFISPGFFETMRAPILAGRDFNKSDNKASVPVAILTQQTARLFFRGSNAIGMSFRENDFQSANRGYAVRVVGIIKDIDFNSPQYMQRPTIFRPVSQCSACLPMGRYEVHYAGSLPGLTKRLKITAASVDPNLTLSFHTQTEEIEESVQQNRAEARMAGLFGLFVGLLAMIGVYGVTSYSTAERTREIGIRLALGARPVNVLRMMLGETMVPVCIGVACGVGASLVAAQMIRGMLWGVSPTDPLSFGFAACLTLLTAGAAAFPPARRAANVDPMVALRYE